ncbi:MAG TPA: glycosyltransferase family 2 protein, partial [Allocoleopsis sp.]
QRSRWAEGGYQRYLDYWKLILSNKMGTKKTIDLIGFFLIQYILPMAAIPDILMAIVMGKPLILTPIASLGFILATVGMLTSLHRIDKSSFLVRLMSTIMGNIYMLHWFIVMGFHTTKMAFLPKKLKWVKTVHQGS